MFAKRLFQKAAHRQLRHEKGSLTPEDVGFRINVHYGIPPTASILAFDPIQRLLAIGTLDGRIKIIGGDNIEGLLISPNLLPYKYLEFLQNRGYLISITNNNLIQVWHLEKRSICYSLLWESNVTAFSVISGSSFMYVGDECGLVSVLKYDIDDGQLLQLPYQLSSDSLGESAGFSIPRREPIVGVLPQPFSSGNRLLIVYESGLIILWDVVDAKILVIRGDKVLHLENKFVPSEDIDPDIVNDASYHDRVEKEISALCWASLDGSMLAVGYVDGDILFWNMSNSSIRDQQVGLSQNVVKLALSSAEKRLPVIVLQWLVGKKSNNNGDGQLLVYGGDEIGCEEVVTVLSLEWSSGLEVVKCVGRVDLRLPDSFADMILIPAAGTMRNDDNASLFVLCNPGQIHIYDSASLSSPEPQSRKELPVSDVNFPAVIPIIYPLMTVAELFSIHGCTERLPKTAAMNSTLMLLGNKKWPLTGGVSNHLCLNKDENFRRVYVAGYQDGSVRIWDATYPVFTLLCILTTEASIKNSIGSGASVTTVDLCSTLILAVGRKCGLVQLYKLCNSNDTSFHFVTNTKSEVCSLSQVQGPRCGAAFSLHKSEVKALEFTDDGSKLIVGYECCQIAVLDVRSSRIAFKNDSIPSPNSPVISVRCKAYAYDNAKHRNESAPRSPDNCTVECIFVLTEDAHVYVLNGNNGNMISSKPVHLKKQSSPISMYVIETGAAVSSSINEQQSLKDNMVDEHTQTVVAEGTEKCEAPSLDRNPTAQHLKKLFVLVCCRDSLCAYPVRSLIQGERKSAYKVKLSKPCCWTTVFEKDEKVRGLVVFYQTGEMEIRSLPDLEFVKEYSLRSELRWNIKTNMERMFSSTNSGLITLVNGCEVAFISLLEGTNNFRIPESLPNLHDEVLAAAASAAISISSDKKRKQGGSPGILAGIVKGLKTRKSRKSTYQDYHLKSSFSDLEEIFKRNPFPEPSASTDENETTELSIDDIEIDEPVTSASTSSQEVNKKNKDKITEREKLLDDAADVKPRIRTQEEILSTYRKTGDAASVAGEARNKLLERQEKLERISKRTEDLRNGAEDFASLANELVKAMENRKWYHI